MKKMADTVKGITVEIKGEVSGIGEVAEKMKQLKSLLQEVKELAASLDLKLTVNGRSLTSDHQEDGQADSQHL